MKWVILCMAVVQAKHAACKTYLYMGRGSNNYLLQTKDNFDHPISQDSTVSKSKFYLVTPKNKSPYIVGIGQNTVSQPVETSSLEPATEPALNAEYQDDDGGDFIDEATKAVQVTGKNDPPANVDSSADSKISPVYTNASSVSAAPIDNEILTNDVAEPASNTVKELQKSSEDMVYLNSLEAYENLADAEDPKSENAVADNGETMKDMDADELEAEEEYLNSMETNLAPEPLSLDSDSVTKSEDKKSITVVGSQFPYTVDFTLKQKLIK